MDILKQKGINWKEKNLQKSSYMSSTFETEGIVLHSLPFKERDRILTLFTPDQGIIKCFCYGNKALFCSPLNRVQVILRTKNSDLFFCQELSVTGHFLTLRQNLATMEAAGEMVRTLLETQTGSKAAENLYVLFVNYLTRLSEDSAATITGSFRLKVLHHEGLIGDLRLCGSCGNSLTELFLDGAEAFCHSHSRNNSETTHFDSDETNSLLKMLYGRFLSEIEQLRPALSLKEKIKKIYTTIILLQDSIQSW